MTGTSGPAETGRSDAEQADLERLADELAAYGCKTVLVSREGQTPYLDVIHPDAALSERVYAQADYFWYGWAEVITRRAEPAAAAQAIARSLRPAGTGAW